LTLSSEQSNTPTPEPEEENPAVFRSGGGPNAA
jgi:hypothetical protein